jgi:hypothetical protein
MTELSVEDIKDRTDIMEIISFFAQREGINVEKAGRNYKAPCPFHDDKDSSFFIFPETQTWRCFGACATGGDVFSLFEKMGRGTVETLHILYHLAVFGKGTLYNSLTKEKHVQSGTAILRKYQEENHG